MSKEEKTVVQEMIEGNEKNLIQLKLRERYLQRLVVTDKNQMLNLGATQREIKETENWIKFLKEQ